MWRNALSAARIRLSRFGFPAHTANCQPESAGDCHIAPPMRGLPSRAVTARLERRGLMIHNRDREAAKRYVDLHLTMIRER